MIEDKKEEYEVCVRLFESNIGYTFTVDEMHIDNRTLILNYENETVFATTEKFTLTRPKK